MSLSVLRLTTAIGFGMLLSALPLAAQEGGAEAPAVALEVVPPAVDKGDAGAYLAGRAAETHGDFRDAAGWFAQATQADPDNLRILDGHIYALLNLGQIDQAAVPAAHIFDMGKKSQLAEFALLTKHAKDEDYAGLLEDLDKGKSIGPLFDQLARAWAEVGKGQAGTALPQFDAIAKTRGFEPFGLYHKALALALAGDFEGAEKILSGKSGGGLTLNRRGLIAYAQILSQLERNPEAIALLDEAFGPEGEPVTNALKARLQAGEPVPFDAVTSARDGIAEVFFSISTVLNGDADPSLTLMHARAALALRPDHVDALLLSAAMLEDMGQYDLAVEAYAGLSPDNPAFYNAEMGRAEALFAGGRPDEAIEVMKALTRRYPQMVLLHAALGDLLRREDRWQEGYEAYGAAIALLEEPLPGQWVLYFNRAVCLERLKRFDEADADFRKALSLNPDQPQVLNYLGYSLLERRKDLPEALKMIETAAKAEPDTGYITDSLAWGYFQLGRYADALAPMEKASLLEPVDPVVTDHLGDVYWMNGRKREAEFQWRRALSFDPEEKDAARIRRKLEIGLDAVIAEESNGAPAPQPSAPGPDDDAN